MVHERAPGEGLGEQSPAEAPVDARPETKRPPYGVNESVRLEEVDESCHGEASLDIDGPAVTWGLDHKVSSAQECCDRCKAQVRGAREKGEGARACKSWVFCPLPECWAPDIWNHTLGECWLRRGSTLEARTRRRFDASTRRRPRTSRGRRGCC